MSEYTTSEYRTIAERTLNLVVDMQNLLGYFYIVMEKNDRENKFELAVKESKFYIPKRVEDLNKAPVYMNLINIFIL